MSLPFELGGSLVINFPFARTKMFYCTFLLLTTTLTISSGWIIQPKTGVGAVVTSPFSSKSTSTLSRPSPFSKSTTSTSSRHTKLYGLFDGFGDALKDAFGGAFDNAEYSAPPEGVKASARHILVKELSLCEQIKAQIEGGEVRRG